MQWTRMSTPMRERGIPFTSPSRTASSPRSGGRCTLIERPGPHARSPKRERGSENRDRVDGRAGDVLEAEWRDGQQELPATALGRRPRDVFEVHVVDEPEAHGDERDDVEGVAEGGVREGGRVVLGV